MDELSICFNFTEDFQIACFKLAQYYLREFTEINLYSPSRAEAQVPLEKLYVAMTWIKCNTNKGQPGLKRNEPMKTSENSENTLCDYQQIFDKVWFQSLCYAHI